MAKGKGIAFEENALNYLRWLFEELGFTVTEARQQRTGTQNGFDIRIGFLDDNGRERKFYFECKDYKTDISWNDISVKIHELHSASHRPDGYIALSPHINFTNIHVNVIDSLTQTIQAPIKYWTPETNVEEYFSLDDSFFEFLYDKKVKPTKKDNAVILQNIRAIIMDMLRQKDEMVINVKTISHTNELTRKIPRINDDDIVGREDELKELHHLLFENAKQVVVVNGLGGIGKTTLAQGYISKYMREYKNVAWITQLSSDIVSDIANAEGLAEKLFIEKAGKDLKELFHEIIERLKGILNGPNLLILDNVDEDLAKLKNYLPGQPHWHVLTTSRNRIEGFYAKQLDFLIPEKAAALFKKHCSRITDDNQIAELVKIVDYHTLTIEILAKTAERNRTPIDVLKNAIREDLKTNVEIPHKGEKIDRVRSYLSSIFNLSNLNEDETWLMKQFTCLPAEYHTYDNLLKLIDPDEYHNGIFAELCSRLVEQGWLLYNTKTEETGTYKMHLVVQEVAIQKLHPSLEDIDQLLRKIIENLAIDQSKDNPVDKFKWIPFGYSLLNNFRDNESANITSLQNNLGLVLKELGGYSQARELLQKAVLSDEKSFGPDHPTTAVSYSNLALVLKDLGEYDQARELLQKVILSDEKNFGPDHPTTAVGYSNLALVLKNLGKYDEARELLQKAVLSDEKNFGSNHPTTVVCYSNLALVLKDLGEYEQARELLQKAVLSDEKNFGPNHPTTAIRYSNLALALKDLGEYEQARELLQKTVLSDESNFGSDHPTTNRSYTNLAAVLRELGEYEQARDLLQKTMLSAESNLGLNHPTTARRYSNLAIVLQNLGEYEQARELLQKAILSDEKNFDPDHPVIALRYSNLATVLQNLGEYDRAQELLRKAMLSAEKNFGFNHPTTAMRYSNLAIALKYQGKIEEAFELSKKSLSILKKTLPAGHPYIDIAQSVLDSFNEK